MARGVAAEGGYVEVDLGKGEGERGELDASGGGDGRYDLDGESAEKGEKEGGGTKRRRRGLVATLRSISTDFIARNAADH